ncbi:MAG: C25 family cysteine peptidase, partial [Candidatus Fermentibacter daniensis]
CLTEGQIGHARAILENIVDNPRDLEACRPEERETDDSWPVWVAIGPASIEATLQPLVDHRNSTGLEAAYVTLDSIYANYTGYDTQEQIRNYLKHAYENQGLIYALIVGDWGPTQRISSLVVGGDSLMLAQTADLYFSDLTRMWDGDGDHLYGENTDWIDYYSDITVGRFSSDVQLHIATMVSKAIAYETESAEGAWRTTALLCGAGLWPDVEPDGYWGSFVCDSISKRIPPSWTQIRRYESRSGHPNDQIDIINRGASYVSDQGHGGPGGVYWYYSPGNMFTNQNYTGMSNSDKLTIFHSMACDPGMLSVNGCSAERLMMWPDGGAVAVMYNSNYGWGTPPSVGPSEWLEIHFANQLFVFGIQRIGDMQAAAKDAFKAAGGMILQNWVLQENNYLGDPAEVFVSRQTGIEGGQQSPESGTLLGPASPNPARGAFSVSWSLPGPAVFDATLEMYDLSGRRVWSCDLQAGSGASGTVMVPGTDGTGTQLPSGCYLLRLDSSSGSAASMVILLGK